MTGSSHCLTSEHAIVTICTCLVLKATDAEISCTELLLVKVQMNVSNKTILGLLHEQANSLIYDNGLSLASCFLHETIEKYCFLKTCEHLES